MEESRTRRLHQLLRRLGQAVHGSVVHSDEVRGCLEELHESGWRAIMLVETSVACDENGAIGADKGTLRLHVDGERAAPAYRMDVDDAKILNSLGIAPGRHRSNGTPVYRERAERDPEGDA